MLAIVEPALSSIIEILNLNHSVAFMINPLISER